MSGLTTEEALRMFERGERPERREYFELLQAEHPDLLAIVIEAKEVFGRVSMPRLLRNPPDYGRPLFHVEHKPREGAETA